MYKAKKIFSFNNTIYEIGDEVKVNTKEELIALNERGFIEPLTTKQIQEFGKTKPKEKISNKKEEE